MTAATLSDAEKIRRALMCLFGTRRPSGRIRMGAGAVDLSDLADESGVHPNTIRAIVRKQGDAMFRRVVVTYFGSDYQRSGRGYVDPLAGGVRGAYFPAWISVDLRE